MKLYFHTDRTGTLHAGSIIEREAYYDESLWAVYTPFMDQGFLTHLNGLGRAGLSLHGARYLIQLQGAVSFPNLTTEIYYEFIRWKHYPEKPSRLQCFFAWARCEDALRFAKDAGKGSVYEVACESPAFVGDANCLKLSFDAGEQERHARRYWEGKALSCDVSYSPCWECLLDLPVEVVREVLVRPAEVR